MKCVTTKIVLTYFVRDLFLAMVIVTLCLCFFFCFVSFYIYIYIFSIRGKDTLVADMRGLNTVSPFQGDSCVFRYHIGHY